MSEKSEQQKQEVRPKIAKQNQRKKILTALKKKKGKSHAKNSKNQQTNN